MSDRVAIFLAIGALFAAPGLIDAARRADLASAAFAVGFGAVFAGLLAVVVGFYDG